MGNDLREKFSQYVGQTSGYPPSLQVKQASGSWITDANNERYLDFISGIAVTNLGHCHPAIVEAVKTQAELYAHTMVYGEHVQKPQVLLAEQIAKAAPQGLDCVYFMTTGAEANDAALKMAVKKTGRQRFIAFKDAYHGDTAGALSCFGSLHFRKQFPGLLADVGFLPFGDEGALEAIDETVAAVIIEPVQGEGGIRVPGREYLVALKAKCLETGTVLIFDEVQTGFGRTGQWFAAQRFDITPDIITMAKGMGAGYPLAGLLAPRQAIYDFAAEPAFSHITTFGGHPVSCAAGLAAMRVIQEDGLLENTRTQGGYLLKKLKELQTNWPGVISEVRGVGLMIGAEMKDAATARLVVDDCRQAGLILETNLLAEAVIRFSPALNVTQDESDLALATFEQAVKKR